MARIIKANAQDGSSGPAVTVKTLGQIAEEARRLVLEARKDAARIAAEARVQADAARETAAQQGYDEGFARGRDDGYQDGLDRGAAQAKADLAARADGLIEQARRVVADLAEGQAALLRQGRCEMLDFALELAEKVVGRVALRDPQAARENLAKALDLTHRAQDVRVKVHPDQLAALEECLPQLIEALGRTGQVRLVGDETVSPGGVELHSPAGEVDATIETQWANIVEALVGVCEADGPGCYRADGASRRFVQPRPPASPKRALRLQRVGAAGPADEEP